MKKLVLLVMALGVFSFSQAQGLDAGVKLGANFSSLSEVDNANRRTGLLGGAFVSVKFANFALQPELLYSQQGASFDEDDIELDYLNVPVMLKYYIVPELLNIQAGPQFGFVMNDNLGDSIEKNDFDVSASVGAGVDIPFGFHVDARYTFGVTEVYEDSDVKHGVISIAVGYSFL